MRLLPDNTSRLLVLCLCAGVTAACPGNPGNGNQPSDGHVLNPDGTDLFTFVVRQVEPDHGPTNGGNEVLVKGAGFKVDSRVYFGERMADPAEVLVLDHTRIACLVPPGTVGPVTVMVRRPEGIAATLENGYTYDPFYVDPASGTVAGGTFVRITGTGTDFQEGDVATFGGNALQEQSIVSSTMITGRTPPGAPGEVAVRVDGPGGTHEIPGAFTYYVGVDPVNGGLGGGPIQGEISVTLLDSYSEEPIPEAFVILGASTAGPYQGLTDVQGRITFSDPNLIGPQMVTAAKDGYEIVSFVTFDAREVTAYMTPEIPPEPGTFPGTAYSVVYGKVRFGGIEHGGDPCQWSLLIPEPGPGKERVIKVYQTMRDFDWSTPSPGEDGIVRESEECNAGWDYFLYTYPGSYAVYAIGGHEDIDTREFTPIAAGFARNIISAPGEQVQADIYVDLGMDRTLDVQLTDPPPLDTLLGPVTYRARLFVDLGGDGYVVRADHVLDTTEATAMFHFETLAPLAGAIGDGHYSVMVDAYNYGLYPYSQLYLADINPDITPTVAADAFVGIPQAVDPPPDGSPSANRMVWDAVGAQPSFHLVLLRTYPDGDAYWRLYLNGTVNQFTLPDLSVIEQLTGHPAGPMQWIIYAITVPNMDFNDFTYRYMSDRYWTAAAAASYRFSFVGP